MLAVSTISFGQESDSCAIEAPNAVTPDSENDNKIVFKTSFNCDLKSFSISVYNRWGEELYTSNDPYEGWDATEIQAGVYVYLVEAISADDVDLGIKGSVVVLR